MPSYSRKVQIPGKTAQELYNAVSMGIDHLMSKAALGKFEIERNPELKEVCVKSSMFSASLKCQDEKMELEGKLSLLASPFKAKIDEGITHWLKKTFNGSKLS